MDNRRVWLLSLGVGIILAFATSAVGIFRLGRPAVGFVPSSPDVERWVVDTMPEALAARGRELGVVRWSVEGSFGSLSAFAEERSFTLGPQAEGGGYLDPEEAVSCWRFRCGWPLHALEMSRWTQGRTLIMKNHIPDLSLTTLGGLPVGVRPIALVGNIAFFTGVVGVLLSVGREWRGAKRLRAGSCQACGHPLAGSPRCPECGHVPESGSDDAPSARR